ncbi:MAG: AbrB family transcriptional regulator [Betaproteobacteria bacterium]
MKREFALIRPFAIALVISVIAGLIFSLIHIPLPWMMGPLFGVGFAGIRGIHVKSIRGSRQAGQLVIGCALGLYFTAEVSNQLLAFGGYILSAAFIAIMIGALGGILLRRIAGTTAITSYFASVPGGAAEMAVLAERAGARFDQVALSHSIRVLVVVSTIPIAVTLTGASGTDMFIPTTALLVLPRLFELAALATGAAFLFMKAGIPNAWLLGPLTASLMLTVTGHDTSAIPPVLINAAQVLIGCSLGARFKPSLLSESRQLIIGVMATAFLTLILSALLGLLMAGMLDLSGATLILATSPGGLSEMCITAKILKLGVPLVTSFQVARLAIVVTFSLPVWRLLVVIRNKIQ